MLWINVAAAILALATTAFGWVRWHRHRSTLSASEARGALAACSLLLDLLAHLQQHRGMSSAWLGGDKSFTSRLADKRAEIRTAFSELVNVAAVETDRDCPCFTANDLSLFRFKWQSLTEKLHELSVEQSIAQHSHMIATVLDWLATYGEARIELPVGRRLPAGTVRNFCHRLPALTECLGQARAIGAGVAVRQGCAPVARVRLMFLATRAESLLKQSIAVGETSKAGLKATHAVENLTRIVRKEMLASAGITVSAEEYFTVATEAVDAVFAWARDSRADMDSMLARPVSSGQALFSAVPA